MLMQVVSFQKLLLMYYFNRSESDVNKRKISRYKTDIIVDILFALLIFALLESDSSLGFIVYFPMLFGFIFLSSFYTKGTRLLLNTLPIKKKFVATNLVLIYPIIIIVFWTVMLAYISVGYIIETVVSIAKSIFLNKAFKIPEFYLFSRQTDIKAGIFALFAGLCIFTVILTICFVRTKWFKVTLAAIAAAVAVVPAVYFHFFAGKGFDDFAPITSWVNKLTTGSYFVSLLIICAVFALFYALCVRLYANRG